MNRWSWGGWFRAAAAAAAMLAAGGFASAQAPFPAKPVHIFVPYAAGGGVDVLARTLGDVVSRQWGQGVVIENTAAFSTVTKKKLIMGGLALTIWES